MKVLMFTHSDMDGYGCKLVMDITMHLLGCHDYQVIVCQNHEIDSKVNEHVVYPNVGPDTHVVFSDIAPSAGTMELLMLMVHDGIIKHVHVFDHHESNLILKDTVGSDAIIYADDKETGKMECGTSIIYMEAAMLLAARQVDTSVIDEKLYADIIDNIRLSDTYTWKVDNAYSAKQLNTMFSMIGGDNFVRKYYDRILAKDNSPMFTQTELEFINGKLDYNNSIINNVSPADFISTDISGYHVALLMKSVAANISDVADSFLERFPEYDAVMNLNIFGNWQISMRTRKDTVNLSDLAVELGGGGHPKASGAPVPKELKEMITDAIIKYLNHRPFTATISCDYEVR